MKQYFTLSVVLRSLLLLLFVVTDPGDAFRGVKVTLHPRMVLTKHGNDKATGYSMQDKVVTTLDRGVRKTHFAYSVVDSSGPFRPWHSMSAWVATYNHDSGEIQNRTRLGPIFDNHGSPSLTADPEGYLHVVYGPHHHPFHYRRSTRPHDTSEWEPVEIVSVQYGRLPDDYPFQNDSTFIDGKEWTYCIVKVDSQGTVHIAGSLLEETAYIRKTRDGWQPPLVLYTAERTYSRYNVMMNLAVDGTVHVMAPDLDLVKTDPKGYWRGDMSYHWLVSTDGGNSFQNRGVVWTPTDGHVQGTGNLAVDPHGYPHFLVNERDGERHRWQWHLYYNGTRWQRQKITIPDRYIWDSSLSIDAQGRIRILSAANCSVGHWRHASTELYLVTGQTGESSLKIHKVADQQPGRNVWLPSIQDHRPWAPLEETFFIQYTDEPHLLENYTPQRNKLLSTRIWIQLISIQQ